MRGRFPTAGSGIVWSQDPIHDNCDDSARQLMPTSDLFHPLWH